MQHAEQTPRVLEKAKSRCCQVWNPLGARDPLSCHGDGELVQGMWATGLCPQLQAWTCRATWQPPMLCSTGKVQRHTSAHLCFTFPVLLPVTPEKQESTGQHWSSRFGASEVCDGGRSPRSVDCAPILQGCPLWGPAETTGRGVRKVPADPAALARGERLSS